MTLLSKVEVGSAMYKEGIRWTECMETFGRTDITYMVIDYLLIFFMISLSSYLRCLATQTSTRVASWQTA